MTHFVACNILLTWSKASMEQKGGILNFDLFVEFFFLIMKKAKFLIFSGSFEQSCHKT